MRILLVTTAPPHRPSHDAARVLVSQLIDHLSDRHTVGVVAATGPTDTAFARAWLAARVASVEIVPIRRWRRPLSGRPDGGLRALAGGLGRASAAFRPDVIHLEGAVLAPLARVADAPCVLACHESPAARARDEAGAAALPWRWLRARLTERLEIDWARRWFDAVGACVVDSEHDRRAVADQLPFERIDVIPAGIDADRYAYRRIGEPGRLVFTGDLGASDLDGAHRLATSILPLVRRQMPRAQLVIASTGSAEAARELERREGVRVEARLADLRPSVWGAGLYVSPAGSGSARTARILEPLALGTPVVASAASLSRVDSVLPGHHALVADTDADFADAIALLMRERTVANTIARNARDLVERSLTWHSVTGRYEEVYQRVAQRRMEHAA